MIVYKFGGATTRTARGLEALVGLVQTAHQEQLKLLKRRTKQPIQPGLVVVISAIGHTTRHLIRTAELAEQGEVLQAGDQLHRMVQWHEQLASTLHLGEAGEGDVRSALQVIVGEITALIEGVAITRELSLRTRDAFLALGEKMAMMLIAALLRARGLPVREIDARKVIITSDDFGRAIPIPEEIAKRTKELVLPRLKRSEVVLMQGFVGASRDGLTTTMGSESSDLTATLLAASLGAKEVVIWKTVPGIFTADPEIVPRAKLLRQLTFAEAEEIGRRGARVIYSKAAHPLLGLSEGVGLSEEVVLRVASPKTARLRSTEIRKALPTAPSRSKSTSTTAAKPKALAIGFDPHLTPITLRKTAPSNPATTREERRAEDRRAEDQLRRAIRAAHYSWTSNEEVHLLVNRESKPNVMRELSTLPYHISEGASVCAISVVARGATIPLGLDLLQVAMLRSLRACAVQAFVQVEASLVAIVPDELGPQALRKLHRDVFGT